MPFKDLDIFLRAAQAILQGSDPYSIPNLEVFYPLPFYFLFIPFVAWPFPLMQVLWTALQALILIAILRGRAALTALSMPVLLTLILGQIDIVVLGLYAALRSGIAGGIALAFLALKPHLVLLLAPWMLWRWWRNDRRQIAIFCALLGVIVALSFVVQPDWVIRFLARSGERTRAGISSSIWGLLSFLPSSAWIPMSALAVLAIVIWAWRKDDFDIVAAAGLLVSPFLFSYNLTPLLVLARAPLVLLGFTVLSWITFAIGAWQSNDNAAALLPIFVLLVLLRQNRTRSAR
jgi:hypothetical protein